MDKLKAYGFAVSAFFAVGDDWFPVNAQQSDVFPVDTEPIWIILNFFVSCSKIGIIFFSLLSIFCFLFMK